MSALDKLSAKAEKKIEIPKKEPKPEIIKNPEEPIKEASEAKPNKAASKEPKKKHAGGRKKREGSFKMINISVPEEIYDELQEISKRTCGGNMTFCINQIIREYIEKNT